MTTIAGIDLERLAHTRPLDGWARYAACAEDTKAFFAEAGHASRRAKKVCAGCPVRYACLAQHLASQPTSHRDYGIWGGTSERERRLIRVALRGVGRG